MELFLTFDLLDIFIEAEKKISCVFNRVNFKFSNQILNELFEILAIKL